jgi:PPK2 family polyphosphate:nucleotide phosphotransferase
LRLGGIVLDSCQLRNPSWAAFFRDFGRDALPGFVVARYTAPPDRNSWGRVHEKLAATTSFLLNFPAPVRPYPTLLTQLLMSTLPWDLDPKFDFCGEHRLQPGEKISLEKIPTEFDGPFRGKEHGRAFTEKVVEEIRDLQYQMFIEGKQSLLIVLQAPDAAGKDGLIRKVLGQMNPQGCRTYPFKVPSELELSHDFLWRIHQAAPAVGMVSIFNRSHYEDVLVVRVEDIVPKSVWKQRYELINQFEKLLAHRGTKILKFYLHISPAEQLERFGKRLDDPTKHWKLNPGDYTARDKWAAYREAYEDVFEKCNSSHAPWHVIPADKKWYRDASVAAIVKKTLQDMNPQLPPIDVDLDEIRSLYEAAKASQGD